MLSFDFISDDKKQGGHILDFEIASGIVAIDKINQFFLILPEDRSFTGQGRRIEDHRTIIYV